MKYILILTSFSLFMHGCIFREDVSFSAPCSRCDSLEKELFNLKLTLHSHSPIDTIRYYIIGDVSDLLEKGVIKRVSGLSRELKASSNLNHNHFTCLPESEIDTLTIHGKLPKIIGSFNPSSYQLLRTDSSETEHYFIIKDKAKFWDFSSYLIIIVR